MLAQEKFPLNQSTSLVYFKTKVVWLTIISVTLHYSFYNINWGFHISFILKNNILRFVELPFLTLIMWYGGLSNLVTSQVVFVYKYLLAHKAYKFALHTEVSV